MQLLTPLLLGSRTARNRIVFGPHETNLGSGRAMSPRHLAYYLRRAEGGVGTIVLEEASVHPSDWPYERSPLSSECGESLVPIATALHDAGALAIAALGHAGGQGSSAYSQSPLWAPSPVPEVVSREVPKTMEPEDIQAVIEGFARAASTAVAAGLDGVEVNGGQFSLLRQFLSDLTNQRGDEYGVDRLRFARELLSAVRRAAPHAILGLRLSCNEMVDWGGIGTARGVEIAVDLSEWIDYLVVVRGSIYSTWATRPDMHVEPGFNLEISRMVRAAVPERVVVIAQGSIIDPNMAEEALQSGACDAVEMTRAQIADPDLAAKVAGGDLARIRPCILCNQSCQVRDVRNPIVSCVGEPSSGHETEAPPVDGPAGAPTTVVVVGGGPAGMECARVAAIRGHRVRLLERSSRLGGSLRVAAAGSGRSRLAALADWLEAECRTLGVEIETDREVTLENMSEWPGTVVLCTGNLPGYRDYTVDDGAVVITAEQLLAAVEGGEVDSVLPEGPITVWDPLGGSIAISIAELLSPSRRVTLATLDLTVGKELSRTGDLVMANTRLHAAGVSLLKRALLRRVRPGAVEFDDRFGGPSQSVEAAAMVDCGPLLPNDALWRAAGKLLPRAGDAVAPRTIYEAVLEGRRLAMGLGVPT